MLTISIDYLRSEIEYAPETGLLTWKKTSKNKVRQRGSPCGRLDRDGYRILNIDNHSHLAHRLAWAIHFGEFPTLSMDHINGVRDDNRIVNLRLATHAQNIANTTVKAASGLKGVTERRNGSWQAQIKIGSVNHYLGCHKTRELAAQAYEIAAKAAFGEFRFSNRPSSVTGSLQ